jgi:hypothetical protein
MSGVHKSRESVTGLLKVYPVMSATLTSVLERLGPRFHEFIVVRVYEIVAGGEITHDEPGAGAAVPVAHVPPEKENPAHKHCCADTGETKCSCAMTTQRRATLANSRRGDIISGIKVRAFVQ